MPLCEWRRCSDGALLVEWHCMGRAAIREEEEESCWLGEKELTKHLICNRATNCITSIASIP